MASELFGGLGYTKVRIPSQSWILTNKYILKLCHIVYCGPWFHLQPQFWPPRLFRGHSGLSTFWRSGLHKREDLSAHLIYHYHSANILSKWKLSSHLLTQVNRAIALLLTLWHKNFDWNRPWRRDTFHFSSYLDGLTWFEDFFTHVYQVISLKIRALLLCSNEKWLSMYLHSAFPRDFGPMREMEYRPE